MTSFLGRQFYLSTLYVLTDEPGYKMFNERDRRSTTVQLMLSTDSSYDNRTIASTLRMQIRTVQRAQCDENKVSAYGYGLWCGFK